MRLGDPEKLKKYIRLQLAVKVVVGWDANPTGRTLAERIMDAMEEYEQQLDAAKQLAADGS